MGRYYYVYVLQSQKDKKFYVGYTKNVQKRFEEHNNGLVRSTMNRRPLKLIYWEGCINRQDATRREKYLKTTWGERYIKTRVSNCQVSHFSVGVNMGDYNLLSHFTKTQLIFVMFERFAEHAFNSKSQLKPYWAENSAFVKCESQLI